MFLAISLPNGIKGKVVDEPVGLIDLAPTLMELVGSEDAMSPTGKSLLPVLTKEQHPRIGVCPYRKGIPRTTRQHGLSRPSHEDPRILICV